MKHAILVSLFHLNPPGIFLKNHLHKDRGKSTSPREYFGKLQQIFTKQ